MDYVLRVPSYGWMDAEGRLIVPNTRQIMNEFWFRLNIFKTKKNWLAFFSWMKVLVLIPCLFIFLFRYFSFPLLGVAFVYSMIVMGTHGTIWYHRYCTHNAYTFTNKFWRFVTRNLTINIVPEETYVISHHVHHALSDQPQRGILVFLCGLGGYLLIRYILDRKPDKQQPEVHWMDKMGNDQ